MFTAVRFHAALAASTLALGAAAHAQGAVFQTPGMPSFAPPAPPPSQTGDASGQTSRFSSVFNPAFSSVVDTLASYTTEEGTSNDGTELELLALELGANAWVDPNAWAYFVAATDGESLAVEEAAIHYTGLGGNHTLRAGRFFADFGKQMQLHPHELRTIDRPLVLRSFLGDEMRGDGLQWDSWTTAGEKGAVRWSIGAFGSLLPEEEEDFDPSVSAEESVADRKDLGDLNFTARVTGFTDVGESGVLQLGASTRLVPDSTFEFAPSGDVAEENSSAVFGVDATYGWTDATGLRKWTFGGELLVDTGEVGAAIVDVGGDGDPTNDALDVIEDTLVGWYAFADYAWDARWSAGAQYSRAELAAASTSDAGELVLYATRTLSEFHRLRLELAQLDLEDGDDSFRVGIQYTAFLGAHSHGVNW